VNEDHVKNRGVFEIVSILIKKFYGKLGNGRVHMRTPVLRIRRFSLGKYSTVSNWHVVGTDFRCIGVERPWKNNQPFISCIPQGTYSMKLGFFSKGGYPAWEVLNVPGRTEIKIHKGNRPSESFGCPLPGVYLGVLPNKLLASHPIIGAGSHQLAAIDSGIAFTRLMTALGEGKQGRGLLVIDQ
jgi:hypothetical protein